MLYLLKKTDFPDDINGHPLAGQSKFYQHIEIERLIRKFDYPGITVADIGSQRNFKPLLSFEKARCHCIIDPYTGAGGNGLSEIPNLPYPIVLFRCLVGGDSTIIPSNFFDVIISVSVIEHIGQEETSYDCKPLVTPDPLQDKMRDDFCTETFRILKPGGITIHTIDHAARNLSFADNFSKADFEMFDRKAKVPSVEDCLTDPDAVRQSVDWRNPDMPMQLEHLPLHAVLVGLWKKPTRTGKQ